MKYYKYTILFALLIKIQSSHSQSIKIFAGISINKQQDIFHSSISGDRDFANGSRTYYQFGVSGDIKLGESSLFFQPGLKLIVKGTSREQVIFTGTGPNDFVKTDLYRKIPYLGLYPALCYKTKAGKNLSIGFSAFPYFALAVGGKEEIPYVEGSTNQYVIQNYSSPRDILYKEGEFKKADFGAGLSVQALLKNKFLLMVSYEQGFSDISDSEVRTIKNRTFGVAAGYVIKL